MAASARIFSASSRSNRLFLFLASLPLLVFLTLPLVGLVARVSLAEVLANLFDTQASQAIRLSVVTTLTTTVLTLLTGIPLAYFVARKDFPGKKLVDALIDLPVVLPPSVAGIALLVVFGRRGLLGPAFNAFGINIAFTEIAVVLAQLFVASPLFVKAAAAGFAGVSRDLEQAAAIDGASRLQVFRTVTVPLTSNALIGGAVMTWARALGEFGATIIFAGNFPGRTQTMPLAIYIGFEIDLNVAISLAVTLLMVSFIILFVVKRLLDFRPTLG